MEYPAKIVVKLGASQAEAVARRGLSDVAIPLIAEISCKSND